MESIISTVTQLIIHTHVFVSLSVNKVKGDFCRMSLIKIVLFCFPAIEEIKKSIVWKLSCQSAL